MTAPVKALLFGTAGVPDSSPQTSTVAALDHIVDLGLDALEAEFVRGVKIQTETANTIRDKASALGLALSVHAPYYISFNSPEPGTRLQSRDHLLRSARMAREMGARSVVFHAGYYGVCTPEQTYAVIRDELREVLAVLRSERNPVRIRIETMGKKSQFGSLDEVLTLCQELDDLAPCLDFSHMFAREGKGNSKVDFLRILRKVEKRLGRPALEDIHIHISGIAFNQKGEIKHLNLGDTNYHYEEWIEALRDVRAEGLVICESPARENDARMLKSLYESYARKS
jgi:deoxyribonuclease IV